jgi:2-keto-4-pentenoate hydratase/2-oxohepta-3-ene-1,7-dioic acid hydratase in catechol pathway
MITPVLPLIAHASETFSLQPGDVVLTGTPAGVGELHSGQRLELELDGRLHVETSVD